MGTGKPMFCKLRRSLFHFTRNFSYFFLFIFLSTVFHLWIKGYTSALKRRERGGERVDLMHVWGPMSGTYLVPRRLFSYLSLQLCPQATAQCTLPSLCWAEHWNYESSFPAEWSLLSSAEAIIST